MPLSSNTHCTDYFPRLHVLHLTLAHHKDGIQTIMCNSLRDANLFCSKHAHNFLSRWEKPSTRRWSTWKQARRQAGRERIAVKVHASSRWRHEDARQTPRHLNNLITQTLTFPSNDNTSHFLLAGTRKLRKHLQYQSTTHCSTASFKRAARCRATRFKCAARYSTTCFKCAALRVSNAQPRCSTNAFQTRSTLQH